MMVPGSPRTSPARSARSAGSIIASQLSFSGDASGTIKGSIVNLEDTALLIGGNNKITIESQGPASVPDGVIFGERYAPLARVVQGNSAMRLLHANHNKQAQRNALRHGLSLVEILISLAISASLLTAIAAAFSASASVIEKNDEVFRATQAARVTMLHLLTEIRQGTVGEMSTPTACI